MRLLIVGYFNGILLNNQLIQPGNSQTFRYTNGCGVGSCTAETTVTVGRNGNSNGFADIAVIQNQCPAAGCFRYTANGPNDGCGIIIVSIRRIKRGNIQRYGFTGHQRTRNSRLTADCARKNLNIRRCGNGTIVRVCGIESHRNRIADIAIIFVLQHSISVVDAESTLYRCAIGVNGCALRTVSMAMRSEATKA